MLVQVVCILSLCRVALEKDNHEKRITTLRSSLEGDLEAQPLVFLVPSLVLNDPIHQRFVEKPFKKGYIALFSLISNIRRHRLTESETRNKATTITMPSHRVHTIVSMHRFSSFAPRKTFTVQNFDNGSSAFRLAR